MANYIIRIFKAWGTRDGSRRWVNNYEVSSTATDVTGLVSAVNTIVEAERLIHFIDVNFLEATVSTWLPDSHPYDPAAFMTLDLTGYGARAPGGAIVLDSNVCWLVNARTATGRTGKKFFRGCLYEGDVQLAADGTWAFTPGSSMESGGASIAAFDAAIAPMLSGGSSPNTLSLISPGVAGGVRVRGILEYRVGGIVVNRRNHRYFDRLATP